ncbi:hypothetical protein [Sinomonas sp. G460-2]|uniref:hypothetical protein n=1 Tax=Sinomonas sp. G460-2 TaxID=3393464 RepID=UPI0039F0D4DE
MSALAIDELVFRGPARPYMAPVLVEDVCADCGRGLALFEAVHCADCADLAFHMECRDCGRVLRDADVTAGACADCLA